MPLPYYQQATPLCLVSFCVVITQHQAHNKDQRDTHSLKKVHWLPFETVTR